MNIAFSIFKFPLLVLLVNIILDTRGVYVALPWIDMPMHFLGGASIGLAGIGFLALLQKQGLVGKLPFLLYAFFVMSFVGLAAASWELWEFSIGYILKESLQGGLADTMADMFFGLLGGLATLALQAALSISRRIR